MVDIVIDWLFNHKKFIITVCFGVLLAFGLYVFIKSNMRPFKDTVEPVTANYAYEHWKHHSSCEDVSELYSKSYGNMVGAIVLSEKNGDASFSLDFYEFDSDESAKTMYSSALDNLSSYGMSTKDYNDNVSLAVYTDGSTGLYIKRVGNTYVFISYSKFYDDKVTSILKEIGYE